MATSTLNSADAIAARGCDRPALKLLNKHVRKHVSSKWHDLGLELLEQEDEETLNQIKSDNPKDVNECCKEMFQLWLRKCSTATWDQLIQALREVDLNSLATKIEGMLKDTVYSGGKNARVNTEQLETPKKPQSQITLDHPDAYAKKFEDDDVTWAFAYLFDQLGILFGEVDFTVLKRACIQRGTLLSSDFKQQIKAANELDDLLDALDNPMYCNWLNTRLLKRIVKTIDNREAKQLIQVYESCVYSRKVSDVMTHFDSRCFNQSHVSSVVAKINAKLESLTVADVIEHCQKLEHNMGVCAGSVTAVKCQPGCLQITCVIPMYCALHAYEWAKTNFLKFRQFHIQYIEIESFPKVFALRFPNDLNNLTSAPETSQVIGYYYTSLENYMDADSVSHMMHCEHLITDDDYEAITAAPNDSKMNTLLLQYVKSMNVTQLSRFCEILKSIETHKIIGDCSSTSFQAVLQQLSANVRVSISQQSMASSIKCMKISEVHMVFYDLVDYLYLRLCVMEKFSFDVIRKCTVNSSFTEQWQRKISSCKSLHLLKIYLLPFITWLNHSILKDLVVASGDENAQQLLDQFQSKIYSYCSQPISSFPIPCPSQLIIPLDNSDYTILSVKFRPPPRGGNTQGMIILQDIMKIKQILKHKWNIKYRDIQLVAVHTKFELLYWMIPKCLVKLIESNLIHDRKSGIIMMAVLPSNFLSGRDSDSEKLKGPFSSLNFLWQDNTDSEVVSSTSLQNKLENIDAQTLAQQYLLLQGKIKIVKEENAIIKEENEKNKIKLNELESLVETKAKLKDTESKSQEENEKKKIKLDELESLVGTKAKLKDTESKSDQSVMYEDVPETYQTPTSISYKRPALKDLLRFVELIGHYWFDLGVELLDDHDVGKLDIIKLSFPHNTEKCCIEMFQLWLSKYTSASWEDLIYALQAIELYHVADEVSQFYNFGMATVSQKISTSEILELLRTNSDHTKFFYMYVSTFGRVEGSEMDSLSQPIPPLPVQENPVAQNSPVLPSTPTKKAQEKAMAAVHKKILPELLYPCGWKKVYDKDMKIAYRALYFNTIEKQPNEDDITHIQRVVKYREMISDKVEKLKEELHVNLEINFLLSRPLLYDPVTLQEQPLREGFTTK